MYCAPNAVNAFWTFTSPAHKSVASDCNLKKGLVQSGSVSSLATVAAAGISANGTVKTGLVFLRSHAPSTFFFTAFAAATASSRAFLIAALSSRSFFLLLARLDSASFVSIWFFTSAAAFAIELAVSCAANKCLAHIFLVST